MKKGRYTEAYTSLCRLRNSELQAARDLYYVHCQLQEEFAVMKGSNFFSRFLELFTIPRVRRATIARYLSCFSSTFSTLNVISQFRCHDCSANVWYQRQFIISSIFYSSLNSLKIIAFYSSSIFLQAGASQKVALVASFGFGLVNFVFAIPAVWVRRICFDIFVDAHGYSTDN
jgi:hypothetical protein